MKKRCELFGHPIINHRRLTYAQQVYQIFVEEIHNGRWIVGKRLPGVAAITAQTGLGNKTIQEAFKMLKDAGYVRAEPYKGTFLASMLPQGLNSSKGRVGILLSEDRASEPYALWMSHILMDALQSRDMVGEVRIVNPEREDMQKVLSRSGPFSKGVHAVISLIPVRLSPKFEAGNDAIPTLFFSTMLEDCFPLLAVDLRHGYYELTRRVICAGHEKTVFIADAGVSPAITELYREGYEKAMAESGLKPLEVAANQNNAEKTEKLFRKLVADQKVTVAVCGSLALIQNLMPLPDFTELVPSCLSLVSIGSDRISGEDNRYVTGVLLNFDYMIQVCFDLLNELISSGRCRRSKVLIVPDFVSGSTLQVLNGTSSPDETEKMESLGTLYAAKQFPSTMSGS